MWQKLKESRAIGYLSLFTSLGTILCCALPATLVLLGFGASLAGFLGEFPQLISISENKEWVFGISFIMLGLSYTAQRYSENEVCPIDKKQDCESAKKWSKPLFLLSLGINAVGAFYAFVLPNIL